MIHKKRLFYPTLLATLCCGAVVVVLHAQDAGGGPPHPPHAPPPSPLFDALDTNHDGVLSSDEIAGASTSLKALLKNGAVQITREDVEPPHPAARERRDRDETDRDETAPPRAHRPLIRPHNPPPMNDQAADDPAPPRPAGDEDRADRPHHRPPPPRWSRDDDAMDGPERRPVDRGERPPRRADGDDRAADDAARPRHPRDDADGAPHRHPPGPLFDALDANHDGVISADEIANAPDALKKLDKTGSGQIKREDLQPPRPAADHD